MVLVSIDLSFSKQLEDLGGSPVLETPCVCLPGVAALHLRCPGLDQAAGQCLHIPGSISFDSSAPFSHHMTWERHIAATLSLSFH